MNKSTDTIHESQSVALGSDAVATSQSVLPYYVDDTKKTKYLSFRATGFTSTESRTLADVTERSVIRWRAKDPEFKRYDTTDVAELRQTHGAAYHSAEFQRNLRSFMELDRRIIARAHAILNTPDGELGMMDTAEQGYLKTIRPMNSAQYLGAMVRATSGDKDEGSTKFDFSTMIAEMDNMRIKVTHGRAVVNGTTVQEVQ